MRAEIRIGSTAGSYRAFRLVFCTSVNSGTKGKLKTAERNDRQTGEHAGGNKQGAAPRIFCARWTHFRRRHGGQQVRGPANPLNLFLGHAQQLMQFAGIAQSVTATVSHLQAEAVEFQSIGHFRGVLLAEELLQVEKECLAGEMTAEELLLQRTPRPVGKRRTLQVEHAFVHIGNHREDAHLHRVARIAQRSRPPASPPECERRICARKLSES